MHSLLLPQLNFSLDSVGSCLPCGIGVGCKNFCFLFVLLLFVPVVLFISLSPAKLHRLWFPSLPLKMKHSMGFLHRVAIRDLFFFFSVINYRFHAQQWGFCRERNFTDDGQEYFKKNAFVSQEWSHANFLYSIKMEKLLESAVTSRFSKTRLWIRAIKHDKEPSFTAWT